MELEKGNGINFVPCLTWVRRGVAKPDPEHVKLTSEELSSVIAQQKNNLKEQEEEEEDGGEGAIENAEVDDEVKVKLEKEEKGKEKTEDDIMKEYGLEDYDQEEEGGAANLLGLGDLTSFADPKVRSNYKNNWTKSVGRSLPLCDGS